MLSRNWPAIAVTLIAASFYFLPLHLLADDDEVVVGSEEARGLIFKVRQGKGDEPAATARPAPAAATPLSDEATALLLSRLEPLPAHPSDRGEFVRPAATVPPPIAGATTLIPFPAEDATDAPTVVGQPLEVARFSPEGEVPLAPGVSVTFSEAMVPVTSVAEVAAQDVPITIAPEVPGRFRWLGTRTILFEPTATRMPMATEFKVELKADARTALGQPAAAAFSYAFATPAPEMIGSYPYSGSTTSLTPKLFMAFDQRIDPQALLDLITIKARGQTIGARILSAQEINSDPDLLQALAAFPEERRIIFTVKEALPTSTKVTVELPAGAPSAEGPRRTAAAQRFTFETHGPLAVEEYRCGWDDQCHPNMPWSIRFSNPLDPSSIDAKFFKITPEVAAMNVSGGGEWVTIQCASKANTRYDVTIDPALRDVFGQTLGRPTELTFRVGNAQAAFHQRHGFLATLDPHGGVDQGFPVYTVNHRSLDVKVYKVKPAQFPEYISAFKKMGQSEKQEFSPPGELVFDDQVAIKGDENELVETKIDLAQAFGGKHGHAIVIVEPTKRLFGPDYRERSIVWVQSSAIALDACSAPEGVLVWASSLADGSSLAGVEVSLLSTDVRATTDASGLAMLGGPAKDESRAVALIATLGDDSALLPRNDGPWDGGSWRAEIPQNGLAFYVVDDRRLYRPGETVNIKGFVREITRGTRGDVRLPPANLEVAEYKVFDPQNVEITTGTMPINRSGGFTTSFAIPASASLGGAWVNIAIPTATSSDGRKQVATYSHHFMIQEFRRPEFEVSVSASADRAVVRDEISFTAAGAYFAGGPLPGAPVNWTVTAQPASYSPPGWDVFGFGVWTPWWRFHDEGGQWNQESIEGVTNAAGEHSITVDLVSVDPPRARRLEAAGTITDVNQQVWSANASALVHPSQYCVGIRSERAFFEAEQPLGFDLIVTDLDGKAIAGVDIELRLARREYVQRRGNWVQVEKDAQTQKLKSADSPVHATFAAPPGGTYSLTARVRDPRERAHESERTVWVAGAKQPPARSVEIESVELVPDRQTHAPGEVVEVLVIAPFADAEGLLTLGREGLYSHQRFKISGTTTTLKIPLESAMIPGVTAFVELVGAAPRLDAKGAADLTLPKRPAIAAGSIQLAVSTAERALSVVPQAAVVAAAPGEKVGFTVTVKDAQGGAVADAEVLLVVVDESILALAGGGKMPDPLATFYAERSEYLWRRHLRPSVLLSDPSLLIAAVEESEAMDYANAEPPGGGGVLEMSSGAAEGAAPPAAAAPAKLMKNGGERMRGMLADSDEEDKGAAAPTPIQARIDMNPLAIFAPELKTDAEGRTTVEVKLPDNLTRYRVQAIAVEGDRRFGVGESSLVARLPLLVRPSPPRFLNHGDTFELPIVVANQTENALEVDVAVRASGVALTAGGGRRVQVPAGDRALVLFPASTVHAGRARFQAAVSAGNLADAATFDLPVYTPATSEAFATYGEQADATPIAQPVKLPADIIREFGGLELTATSTQLGALTDAVLYLNSYPFECAEQIASRIIGVAAMRDALAALAAAEMPSPAELEVAMVGWIEGLAALQNEDGSYGFWRRNSRPYPYLGIHAAHAFARAEMAGHKIPEIAKQRSLNFLRNVDAYIDRDYDDMSRRSLNAYALSVRKLFGDDVVSDAKRQAAVVLPNTHSIETCGWLLMALDGAKGADAERASLLRSLANRVTETAATAHFVTSYGEGDHLLLHSSRRSDAVALSALIAADRESDLIQKLVRGLLDHRKRGRWENTQENVFALLALGDTFRAFESQEPNFNVRAWLGESLVFDEAFAGRSADRRQVTVPFDFLARSQSSADGTENLVIAREGEGRVYWRLGMRYAPASYDLAALDAGFTVERRYFPVGDPDSVKRNEDGSYIVKAGATVRIEVSMVATGRRYHVALIDPLPAGFEPLNPALAGAPPEAQVAPSSRGTRPWWSPWWYEHENLRDDRAEAFTSLLWDGVYTYAYTARATTAGVFVVPPARAEEMYHPETFGRSASTKVTVE